MTVGRNEASRAKAQAATAAEFDRQNGITKLRDAMVSRLDLLIEAEGLIEEMSRWMSCVLPAQWPEGGSEQRRTELQQRAFDWKERFRDV